MKGRETMDIITLHIIAIHIISEQYLDGKIELSKYIEQVEERLEHIKEKAGY